MFDSVKIAVANILMLVLSLGMLGSGMIKLVGLQEVVVRFETWSYPSWFMILIGVIELGIGITLFLPKTRKYAVIALMVVMTGAVITHLYNHENGDIIGPVAVMMACLTMTLLYFSAGKQEKS